MPMRSRWGLGLWCLVIGVGAAQADTLYRCKAYSGGAFWSREPCGEHGALLDRTASVPSGLGFAQQQRLAEQGLRETREATAAQEPSRAQQDAQRRQARAVARHQQHCERLHAEQERQDALSRQPSSCSAVRLLSCVSADGTQSPAGRWSVPRHGSGAPALARPGCCVRFTPPVSLFRLQPGIPGQPRPALLLLLLLLVPPPKE